MTIVSRLKTIAAKRPCQIAGLGYVGHPLDRDTERPPSPWQGKGAGDRELVAAGAPRGCAAVVLLGKRLPAPLGRELAGQSGQR